MGNIHPLHEPQIHNEGIWADHDMACAVCHVHPAVVDCQKLTFAPCWECQQQGWELRKRWLWPWQRVPEVARIAPRDPQLE